MVYKRKMKASASKIALYQKCPRLFYYKYILKIQEPKTTSLIKGSAAHKVLEDFFAMNPRNTNINAGNYQTELYVYADNIIDKVINMPITNNFGKTEPSYKEQLKELCDADIDLFLELHDMKKNIHNFLVLFIMQLENYVKKYNNFPQAYYMLRPKFREFEIDLENLIGYIDCVFEKDDLVYILDYKSSSLYKTGFDKSYIQQLKLYAYAWYKMKGVIPDIGEIYYLKFGRECAIEFDKEHIIQEMEDLINEFYDNVQHTDIKYYSMNTMHQFCTCNASKNPNGFKNGGGCWFARFCNQELKGNNINYTIEE